MGVILEKMHTQLSMVNTAVKLITDNQKNYLGSRRQDLIDYCVAYMAPVYIEDGYSRSDIKELVTEILARYETDDHGWYLDLDSSNSDEIKAIHPQRKDKPISIHKRFLLLPFNLLS